MASSQHPTGGQDYVSKLARFGPAPQDDLIIVYDEISSNPAPSLRLSALPDPDVEYLPKDDDIVTQLVD